MRFSPTVVFFLAVHCLAQAPAPIESGARPPSITVPQGTRVGLGLTAPLDTRVTRPGDAIRAVVNFPVAVGDVVAIPAGAFVEGVIDKVMHPRSLRSPAFLMHFTRMIFPNGYTLLLNSADAQAEATPPRDPIRVPGAMGFQAGPLPTPTITQPSIPKPKYWIAGAVAGAGTAVLIAVLLLRGGDRWLPPGATVDMVFQGPLTLDLRAIVTPAGPPAQ